MASQSDRVAQFRGAHAKGQILVLPNAWDAASARLVQDAGAKAVATSSAAVAWSNGYADGEGMSRDVAIAATREVLRVVSVPVTVDSEAGYSSDPAQVAEHCMHLIEIGVAGLNIEDGKETPDLLAAIRRVDFRVTEFTPVDVLAFGDDRQRTVAAPFGLVP